MTEDDDDSMIQVDHLEQDPTSRKYEMLFSHMASLRMKDVRQLFCKMRNDCNNPDILFPVYGFTAGEFTLGYVFNMPNRSKHATAVEDE